MIHPEAHTYIERRYVDQVWESHQSATHKMKFERPSWMFCLSILPKVYWSCRRKFKWENASNDEKDIYTITEHHYKDWHYTEMPQLKLMASFVGFVERHKEYQWIIQKYSFPGSGDLCSNLWEGFGAIAMSVLTDRSTEEFKDRY